VGKVIKKLIFSLVFNSLKVQNEGRHFVSNSVRSPIECYDSAMCLSDTSPVCLVRLQVVAKGTVSKEQDKLKKKTKVRLH